MDIRLRFFCQSKRLPMQPSNSSLNNIFFSRLLHSICTPNDTTRHANTDLESPSKIIQDPMPIFSFYQSTTRLLIIRDFPFAYNVRLVVKLNDEVPNIQTVYDDGSKTTHYHFRSLETLTRCLSPWSEPPVPDMRVRYFPISPRFHCGYSGGYFFPPRSG